MSSMQLCWAYRTTAAASGPTVGEKASCNPHPRTLSSESFCPATGRRFDCCKRLAQKEVAEAAAVSDTKRRKLDDTRQTVITKVDAWNKTYPVDHGKSWLHSSAAKNGSDHLLPRDFMKVLCRDSSVTTKVATPRTVHNEYHRREEQPEKLKLTHVKEERFPDIQGFHMKSITNESLRDDIKIRINETKVNAKNAIEFNPYEDMGSVVNESVDNWCNVVKSTHGHFLNRSCTSRRHSRSDLSKTLHNKKAKNMIFEDAVESGNLGKLYLKNVSHRLYFPACWNNSIVDFESSRGFLFVVDSRLRILYISENVYRHLGYQQRNMVGHSMEEYVPSTDLHMVRQLLKVSQEFTTDVKNVVPEWMTQKRVLNVSMRMCLQDKSTRGLKEHGYQLVEWTVKLNFQKTLRGFRVDRLIALCRPADTASMLPCILDGNMFISRHDLNLRFTFCDHRLASLTGYEPDDLIGWAPYHFISPWDAAVYKLNLQTLMSKGASISRSYRFLCRSGVWVGMVTQATVVFDTRRKPRYIACKNHIVRDERIQQKLNKEKDEFIKMKCLSLSIEDDLPLVNQLKSNKSPTNISQDLKNIGSDLFLKELFITDQPNRSASPWCRTRTQKQLITISSPNVTTSVISTEPFISMAVDSIQNLSPGAILKTISDYHINKLPLDSENKSIHQGEILHAHQADTAIQSVNNICEKDMFDTHIDSCQNLESQCFLTLENTVDTISISQVFACTDPVDRCLLTDTILEPSWTHMEVSDLNDIDMADCESVLHQRNTDNNNTESVADKQPQIVNKISEDNAKLRWSHETYSALKSAQQASDKLNDLCLPQTPPMLCRLPQENVPSPSGGDFQQISKSNCHNNGHRMPNASRNILSGKLSSLLQLEPVTTLSTACMVKEEFAKHTSDLFHHEKNTFGNTYTEQCVASGNIQSNYNRTLNSETDILSDSIWCVEEISPTCDISSLVCELPLLDHDFLSSPSSNVSRTDTKHADSILYCGKPDGDHPSLCAPIETTFSHSENMSDLLNSYFSIMTDRKYDPFLNQTSFKDLNPMTYTDQTNDTAPSKCSVNSHFVMSQTSLAGQNKQLDLVADEINCSDFIDTADFLVSSSCLSDAQFVSECFETDEINQSDLNDTADFLVPPSSLPDAQFVSECFETDEINHSDFSNTADFLVSSSCLSDAQFVSECHEKDEINHSNFNYTADFLVPSSSLSDSQFASECFETAALNSEQVDGLDTFLGNTSTNPCLATHCYKNMDSETMMFTHNESFDPQLASDSSVCCGYNDSQLVADAFQHCESNDSRLVSDISLCCGYNNSHLVLDTSSSIGSNDSQLVSDTSSSCGSNDSPLVSDISLCCGYNNSHLVLDTSSSIGSNDSQLVSDTSSSCGSNDSPLVSDISLCCGYNNSHLVLDTSSSIGSNDSQLVSDTSSSCGSNDSSDSETLASTSLLRTLLDKEGKFIQRPLTYTEWIFEQALKKNSDIRKTKISYIKTKVKRIDNRRARHRRSIHGKSVNLPLPISSNGVKLKLSKTSLPYKKPTKELPLPVLTKTTQPLSLSSQKDCNSTKSTAQNNDQLHYDRINNYGPNSPQAPDLPDDLLDMAMEYCAYMEADQEDALITDLNDNFLSDDHFNSLCRSPSQDIKSGCSSNTHNSLGVLIRSGPNSDSCESKESITETSINKDIPMHFLESRCLNFLEPGSNLKYGLSQCNANTVNSLEAPLNLQTNSGNTGSKMSLLRTAVMTADVDNLIKNIPLRNACKYSVNSHDELVPKSMKLQKHSVLSPARVSRDNACQKPPSRTIKSQESLSVCHPLKHCYNRRKSSYDKSTIDYVYKTALSTDSSSNICSKPKSESSPFVLKIRIHQGYSPKANNPNKNSANSCNQKLKYTTAHTTARTAEMSVTDSSATQPVSVIIMRKENNRSKRSKSVAIQTDNEPGEKYPEFEHSPSDTFLYPSVIVYSPNSTMSDECDISPASTSQLSPTSTSQTSLTSTSSSLLANMSELEKCLCSHLSASSSSPQEDDYQTLPNTSFLQRLLMGQLSKDQYQHLDKQMMDAERGVLISSGVS